LRICQSCFVGPRHEPDNNYAQYNENQRDVTNMLPHKNLSAPLAVDKPDHERDNGADAKSGNHARRRLVDCYADDSTNQKSKGYKDSAGYPRFAIFSF
jgi:hypothetical protein